MKNNIKKNITMSNYSKLAISLMLPLSFTSLRSQAQQTKPNVIYIVIDDLGWGDVGYNGSKLVPTPNIDRLAARGVTFTDGYATAPICSPSRNGLISGIYQQKFGIQINADYKYAKIPEKQKLLPETMKTAGYRTALVGKWHIVRNPETVFDEVYDPIEVSSNYFPDSAGIYSGPRLPILGSKAASSENEYMTNRLTNDALLFMHKNLDHPFFLYLGYNAVHNPWQADKAYYDKLSNIKDETLRVYAALIASADDNIGKLLNFLENTRMIDNTLIVLVSDNGPAKAGPELKTWDGYDNSHEYIFGQTAGLRGHKVDLFEGGIRTPMMISYTPLFREGKVFKDMISTLDFYPTICDVAGITVPEGTDLDGVSLVKYLQEETKQQPHDILFWCRLNFGAVRMGIWKLDIEKDKSTLYNLRVDPGETTDVSAENEHIKTRMMDAWNEWHNLLPQNASKSEKPDNSGFGE
jgi:arylsulfatase B